MIQLAMHTIPFVRSLLLACLCVTPLQAVEQPITNWIAQITAAGNATHSNDYLEIMRGCTHEVTLRTASKTQSKMSAQDWHELVVYRDWLTNGGNTLADNWATNGTLTPAEQEYIPILKATYMFRGWTPNMGNPANPPLGCNFSTRCPVAMDICRQQEPEFVDVGGGHWVACFKVTGQ